MNIDLREALNTISDVVQNRPAPIREFDQIYMKVGDMVIQSEYIARVFNGYEVVFIGDGDAISSCVMHLKEQNIIDYGPSSIHVLDFDQRIVNSVNKFASENKLINELSAELYNVADPLPISLRLSKNAFYTNPPWGASNEGESVAAFVQRGIEAIKEGGYGAIVIADDPVLQWTHEVLHNTQKLVIDSGFVINEMIPGLHSYHLDDAPDLKSCTLMIRQIKRVESCRPNVKLCNHKLNNFYGKNSPLIYRYIKDLTGLNYGKAHDGSYKLEPLEIDNDIHQA
ncbi:MAG: bis-aminopropyl spermidine synthase family protein [Pseudomonadota bacterium]